jgi:hypothetical protein
MVIERGVSTVKFGRLLFFGIVLGLVLSNWFNMDFGPALAWAVGLIVASVFGFHFFRELARRRPRTLKLLSSPLPAELPPAVLEAIERSPVLMGPSTYPRRVVWEEKFLDNWILFANRVQSKEVETHHYVADLIIDPSYPGETHAVAVAVGGYVMGYLPRVESAEIYDFLTRYGGIARCNAELKVNLKTNEFDAKLAISQPFELSKS